jgi:hypothetical protein
LRPKQILHGRPQEGDVISRVLYLHDSCRTTWNEHGGPMASFRSTSTAPAQLQPGPMAHAPGRPLPRTVWAGLVSPFGFSFSFSV